MKINVSRKSGFTLVEIMIVVAIIGLLAAIAIPNFVRARTTSQKNACINNLRQIDGAKQQWALETKQAPSATPTYGDISGYLKNAVSCPSAGSDTTFGGSYEPNDCQNAPTCTTAGGGTANAGTLFKVNTNGSGFAVLHNFTGSPDGSTPQAGLTLSARH